MLTIALLSCCFLLLAFLLQREIGRPLTLLVVCCFALMPGAWLNSADILSENFFIVISIASLLIATSIFNNPDDIKNYVLLALLFVITVMSRTIGFAILPALAIASTGQSSLQKRHKIRLLIVLGSVLILWFGWKKFILSLELNPIYSF